METVDGLAVMGLEAKSSTSAELAVLLDADTRRWGPTVKAIGFTAESQSPGLGAQPVSRPALKRPRPAAPPAAYCRP